MSFSAQADVPTGLAAKYLQQLCKHWQHGMPVTFDASQGCVTFPRDARGSNWQGDGQARFEASADRLHIRIDASSAAHLETLQQVVSRHLDRFAFREAPLPFHWTTPSVTA